MPREPRHTCRAAAGHRGWRSVPFRSSDVAWRLPISGEGEGGGRQYRPVMLVRCNVAGDITGHGSRYVDQLKEEVIYIYFI